MPLVLLTFDMALEYAFAAGGQREALASPCYDAVLRRRTAA